MLWADLYAAGRTIQSIADEAGCSYWQVRQALLKAGVRFRLTGKPAKLTLEEKKERLRKKSLRQYHAQTPEKRRRRNWSNWLKVGYDLTIEKFDAMLIAQSGRCGLCGKPMKNPSIDHDHKTGKVRALLHPGCNAVIGMVETVLTVEDLVAYLERYRG